MYEYESFSREEREGIDDIDDWFDFIVPGA
jgi:hypothetical protein